MESARCKAFIESVERGSFRAAAEALGYTPSAVSQLVAAFEKDLGLTLLVRSKKGVTVTSEGAKLAPIVRTFQRDDPEVQFDIMEGIRSEIFGHLDDHVADMGFLAYAEPLNYEWTPLAKEAVIAVVPENHRLADAKAYPVSECENDDFIMTSWGKDQEIQSIFRRYNVTPNVKYTTYDTPASLFSSCLYYI